MNRKQLFILQELFAKNPKAFKMLSGHFSDFVRRDLASQTERPPWRFLHWTTPELSVEDVLRYFEKIASQVDLSRSSLTIEQMLHIAVMTLTLESALGFPRPRPVMLDPHFVGMTFLTMPKERDAVGAYEEQVLEADTELTLTPMVLRKDLVPYIDALERIELLLSGKKFHFYSEFRIKVIKQRSAIELNLQGAADVVEAVKEDIIPWRRKNAQKIADLKARELEAEVEKKKAEAAVSRAASAKDEAEAERIMAEAAKAREECARIKLENEKLRFELDSSKFELAQQIASKMNPDSSEREKILFAIKLLPHLGTVAMSTLEFTVPEERLLVDGDDIKNE